MLILNSNFLTIFVGNMQKRILSLNTGSLEGSVQYLFICFVNVDQRHRCLSIDVTFYSIDDAIYSSDVVDAVRKDLGIFYLTFQSTHPSESRTTTKMTLT